MNQELLNKLQEKVQEIIDAIAKKEFKTANNLSVNLNDEIDEIVDTTNDDDLIIEVSKYQALLNHLQVKINASE